MKKKIVGKEIKRRNKQSLESKGLTKEEIKQHEEILERIKKEKPIVEDFISTFDGTLKGMKEEVSLLSSFLTDYSANEAKKIEMSSVVFPLRTPALDNKGKEINPISQAERDGVARLNEFCSKLSGLNVGQALYYLNIISGEITAKEDMKKAEILDAVVIENPIIINWVK